VSFGAVFVKLLWLLVMYYAAYYGEVVIAAGCEENTVLTSLGMSLFFGVSPVLEACQHP